MKRRITLAERRQLILRAQRDLKFLTEAEDNEPQVDITAAIRGIERAAVYLGKGASKLREAALTLRTGGRRAKKEKENEEEVPEQEEERAKNERVTGLTHQQSREKRREMMREVLPFILPLPTAKLVEGLVSIRFDWKAANMAKATKGIVAVFRGMPKEVKLKKGEWHWIGKAAKKKAPPSKKKKKKYMTAELAERNAKRDVLRAEFRKMGGWPMSVVAIIGRLRERSFDFKAHNVSEAPTAFGAILGSMTDMKRSPKPPGTGGPKAVWTYVRDDQAS